MVYTPAFSPHYLHNGDSRGIVNIVSVTGLVLWACSWPALISVSVWIFESAFRNQLQVFLHVLFRVFLIKLTMQLSVLSFQVSIFSSLFQDVFNQLNWQFPHFQYTLPLTPYSKTSQEFLTTPHLTSHTPFTAYWFPTLILHWYIRPINISFGMESTIHCRSTPLLSLNPMFSVLPLPILAAPYLISTDTAQVFKNRYNLILSIQC